GGAPAPGRSDRHESGGSTPGFHAFLRQFRAGRGMNVTSSPMASHEAALNALPHAILSVDGQGRISDANMAAEAFFDISAPVMRRYFLKDLLPFGSPLVALIEQ